MFMREFFIETFTDCFPMFCFENRKANGENLRYSGADQ